MFSAFFISRPIFATVIAIVFLLAGSIAFFKLPVAQYPDITPPTVQVSAIYPGANAATIAETVGTAIEEEVNGVEGMIYMSSISSNTGTYTLTVTFEVGTDPDMAQVLVQNRVTAATPSLPSAVVQQGVDTQKKSAAILFMIALYSPEGTHDGLFLSNYANIRLVDGIKRISGVGDVTVFGAGDYSMRIWLDPNSLRARGLTTQDVVNAVQEQNVQVAAGQIGAPPAPPGQSFEYTINTQGRFTSPQQFEDIILRADGTRITRIRDVGRVELGSQNYDLYCELDGAPAAGIAIYQLPGSNALDLASQVIGLMDEFKETFPEDLDYIVPYDTTKFVEASIHEVYVTLLEAAALVILVIFVFLQDWRATLIPVITIPVSLIGTLAVLLAIGFSLNLLTLFGLVLAIGIVVDDAIIVVENVWQHLEKGLSSKEAALVAMQEISGPVVATTLVLVSVFIPTAFLPGITGQMYRQFAITIAVSTIISSINALTLSPAMSALLLRAPSEKRFILFRLFNTGYGAMEKGYVKVLGGLVRRTSIGLLIFVILGAAAAFGFTRLPTGFLPTEDQGVLLIAGQLPDAASQERTRQTTDRIDEILKNTPGVEHSVVVGGYSLLDSANASNALTYFVSLKDWEERTAPDETLDGIVAGLRHHFAGIQDALVFPVVPPAINGLGAVGGFQFMLEDRAGAGLDALQEVSRNLVHEASSNPLLTGMNTTFSATVPQLYIDVDRTQAMALGIPLNTVFSTLQAFLGSTYVNDFTFLAKTYQVRVQAEPWARTSTDNIGRLQVRNQAGEMIPMSTIIEIEETLGPQNLTRYNLYPAASINGEAAPGFSSGQAINEMMDLGANMLPPSMGYDWTGMSYQEVQVGSQAVVIFALAVLMVFLVLAAQYESWTAPLAVVLSVPLAILGVVIFVALRKYANDVYTQIGIVLIIGLATKTAILMVEFAREKRHQGEGLRESALDAAKLRFRAILMTAFSALLGFMPLYTASGAGAASRRSLGTAVVGGMCSAVLLSVLLVPVFFVILQGLSEWGAKKRGKELPQSTTSTESSG